MGIKAQGENTYQAGRNLVIKTIHKTLETRRESGTSFMLGCIMTLLVIILGVQCRQQRCIAEMQRKLETHDHQALEIKKHVEKEKCYENNTYNTFHGR